MKKFFIAVFAACSILSIQALQAAQEQPQTFEDKPASGRRALGGARVIGVVAGGIAGMKVGGIVGGKREVRRVSESFSVPISPEVSLSFAAHPIFSEVLEEAKAKGEDTGSSVGVLPGILAGYYGAESAAMYALAKLHGVSYRMELISQYYNVNLSQYGQLLKVASLHNPDALIQAIDELFTLRFEADWKKRLEQLFNENSFGWGGIVTKSKNFRDFSRMRDLGAAMAHLYYGTKPNLIFKNYPVELATKLYKELGLLK